MRIPIHDPRSIRACLENNSEPEADCCWSGQPAIFTLMRKNAVTRCVVVSLWSVAGLAGPIKD